MFLGEIAFSMRNIRTLPTNFQASITESNFLTSKYFLYYPRYTSVRLLSYKRLLSKEIFLKKMRRCLKRDPPLAHGIDKIDLSKLWIIKGSLYVNSMQDFRKNFQLPQQRTKEKQRHSILKIL